MKTLVEVCKRIEDLYPFFQICIRSMSFNQTTDSKYCPTAFVTPELKMVYNYKFVKKLNANEFATVIAHECLHILNNHFKRMEIVRAMNNDAIPLLTYNLVQDLEVNSQLKTTFTTQWFEDEPPLSKEFEESILLPEKQKLADGLTFEQYLMLLKSKSNNKDGGKGSGSVSMPNDDMARGSKEGQSDNDNNEGQGGSSNGGGSDDPNRQKMFNSSSSNRMVENVIKKTEEFMKSQKNSKTAGNTNVDSYDKYVTSRIRHNWKRLVKMIVNSSVQADEDYSFSTINRRHQFDEVIFPGTYKLPSSHNILLLCDVSGSMYDELKTYLSYFSSLIEYMKRNGHKIELSVMFVSEHVHSFEKNFMLKPNQELLIPNGGGTDLTVGIKYIKENNIKHDHLFILTDTYTPWPESVKKKDKMKTTVLTSCMVEDCLKQIPYNYYIIKN